MTSITSMAGYRALLVAALATVATGFGAASAQSLSPTADTEAFAPQNVVSRRPNVLFLVDSTLSLGTTTSQPPYDPSVQYSTYLANNVACSAENTAYFDPAGAPDCTKKPPKVGAIPIAKLYCDAAYLDELTKTNGSLRIKLLEKKVKNGVTSWLALTTAYPNASGDVYCEQYSAGGGPLQSDFDALTSDTSLYWSNYTNYTKAIPYLPAVPGGTRMEKLKKALEIIAKNYKDKINIGMMRTSTTGARQSGGAGTGGMVVFPIESMDKQAIYGAYHADIDGDGQNTTLDDFLWTMDLRVACKNNQNCLPLPQPPVGNCIPGADCVPVMYPNGGTKPLAEMLYEAYLYYTGQDVQYGTRSAVDPTIDFDSIAESIANPNASVGNKYYLKPTSGECQNNYIIMLTDGISGQDSSSNTDIKKLVESLPESVLTTGGYTYTRAGQLVYPVNSWSSNAKAPSEYIDDLAFYLHNARKDYAPLMPATGVTTYTVGFQLTGSPDQADATQLLNDIAKAGGTGRAFMADDASQLTDLLEDIVTLILTGNTSFSAPSVTINAFNRTQNLNDLYMAVFRPEYLRRWKGNVKKYKVDPASGVIMDIRQDPLIPAVDPTTGFFTQDSQSFWAFTADGAVAPQGGAAARIPTQANRKIYVDSDGTTLDALSTYNSTLNATDQGTIFDLTGTPAEVTAEANTLVAWLYGHDTYDEAPARPDDNQDGFFDDGNGITDEDKSLMGDPLHSRPAVVVYGAGGDAEDAVVYITTNEGLLHAIDAKTGVEKWSFAPKELLYRLEWLKDRATKVELADRADPRYFGLDGTIRVLRIDRDGDGPIDSSKGDRVFIYFGMRRGGSAYYAFDVTNPASPKMMWRFALPDGAQSWSNPVVGSWVRANISGATYGSSGGFNNADANNRFVVLVGGGYDVSNDAMGFSQDDKGNKIYMLDAASGAVLWSAGPDDVGSTADLKLSKMKDSIVSDVRVVDLSGDNFADRMYAADLGGQVWRFDISNGKTRAELVNGGVMASVGGESGAADRRFFYGPDVAEVNCGGNIFYNVAVGSGNRERPVNDTTTANAFFSFRDTLLRTQVDSVNYRDSCAGVTDPCFETIYDDARLVDVTTTPNAAIGTDKTGWKMNLVSVDLSVSPPSTDEKGEKALAESRTFASNIYFTTYSPEPRTDGDCGTYVGINRLYVVSACNAAPVNNFDGVAGATTIADRSLTLAQGSIAPEVVFIFPSPPPGCTTRDCMPPPQCLVGLQSCGRGMANNPVRVFWRERGAE